MKFYSFEDIRRVANCIEIAKELYGVAVADGRCPAAWRGGDNPTAVAIEPEKWYDFVQEKGGGCIELAAFRFGGDIQQAQQWLGEKYGLTPRQQTVAHSPDNSRFSKLISEGYRESARWDYRDLSGKMVHFVIRLDHPEREKEFVQGNPKGWGLNGVETILYNLSGWADSPWACIVEGEKCADALIRFGVPATTCAGGAKKWMKEYSAGFAGKHVAILPDNDEPGREHASIIAASLLGVAQSVRIVPTSQEPKGDVFDWLEAGGTADRLSQLIAAAPGISASDLAGVEVPTREPHEITEAKQANKSAFRNYTSVKSQSVKGKREVTEEVKEPRHISAMIDDIHRRFLGFPRKIGQELFDHDRDTGEIRFIYKPADLFSWIGIKSKHQPDWSRGDAMLTKDEFLSGLRSAAIRYESISYVPDWPRRGDVYYAHPEMPRPDHAHKYFNGLVKMFCPASPEYETLLRAFISAPLWYREGIPRPMWIVDSEDGPGTGKTTMVEMVAHLYRGQSIRTGKEELKMGVQELIKRLLSSEGRQSRILLVDNVTGNFSCQQLADLVTAQSISGRQAYGRGEETRPNNLTYTITANSAYIDTDLASRAYFVFVKRPHNSPTWKQSILTYIETHRLAIIADIIDILNRHSPFEDIDPSTRFPEFEVGILQAHCKSIQQYDDVLKTLLSARTESNTEEEQAKEIEEAFRGHMQDLSIDPDRDTVFIRSQVAEAWVKSALDNGAIAGHPMQMLRNMSKMKLLPAIDPKLKIWPHNGQNRRKGCMWNKGKSASIITVYRDHGGSFCKSFDSFPDEDAHDTHGVNL